MVTLETLRLELRERVLQLAEQHGARNLRVFGSVARNPIATWTFWSTGSREGASSIK